MVTQELTRFFDSIGKWQDKGEGARAVTGSAPASSFVELLQVVLLPADHQVPENGNAYTDFSNLSPGPALGAPINTAGHVYLSGPPANSSITNL